MTIDEFIKRLSQIKRSWIITSRGRIRDEHDWCPIESMAEVDGAYSFGARKLGLSHDDAKLIVFAADDQQFIFEHESLTELRKRLLKACGLPS